LAARKLIPDVALDGIRGGDTGLGSGAQEPLGWWEGDGIADRPTRGALAS
jgi:hypothetical protein